ncbi:hypothetical protein [Mycolicibacterium sarraceniae]|uniref:Uncharacterized protein n=1 Tax=Mycolicibacterium sarraceniae TaxID=1534348 RepID=A0A7I7SNG3_9MYCO|nr:hypothetical protein MSAR_07010 [Mycolicibacterium sarraceniae]
MDAWPPAARSAFDDSDWSRDVARRAITVAEVGAAVTGTHASHLQGPINDRALPADSAETYPWTTDLGEAAPMGIATRRELIREPYAARGPVVCRQYRSNHR